MSAVTIHSDFRAQVEEICHSFHLFPFYLSCSNGARCHDLRVFFLIFGLKLSSLTIIKRFFSFSLLSAIRVVSPAYLRMLMFLPPILIPACNSSSPEFLMMCSVYRLNRQPCHTSSLYITCQFILLAISISIKYLPYKKHLEECKRRYINEKKVLWVFKKLNLTYKKSCDRAHFSSVTQSCPTLCDPMDHSMPGLPVHHQLPEFTQTHVHWLSDAIQPSFLFS